MPVIRTKKGEPLGKKPYGDVRPDGRLQNFFVAAAPKLSVADPVQRGTGATEQNDLLEGKESDVKSLGNSEQSSTSRIAVYLAGLSMEDAEALYRVMLSSVKVYEKNRLDAETVTMLETLDNAVNPNRPGSWYLKHVTCSIAELDPSKQIAGQQKPGHTRFQVRMGQGSGSRVGQIKAALSLKAWETFKELSSTSVKIFYHHIAYNADLRREAAPIPANVGVGASISHLCDEVNCICQAHLEATTVHRDNMDRQRCIGIRLLCFRGFIVDEVPCSHGRKLGETLDTQILASCLQIEVMEISEGSFAACSDIHKMMSSS
jgi:hypothetical protein